MKPASPLSIFVFLLARTIAGGARRRLKRLKEPRYLLGTCFAILYFAMIFGRPGRRPPRSAAPALAALPPGVLLGAAFGLTAIALLAWIFKAPRAALPLGETEVQFLFPAPLTRRAVLRFALLRGQLAILLGAGILSLASGGGRAFLPAWVIGSAVNLHAQGIAFTKARWSDLPGPRKAALFSGSLLAAAGALTVAALALAAEIGKVAVPAAVAAAGEALLGPARLLLLPAFRPAEAAPLAGALALLVLHFLWVDRSAARFEEGTLALAARRAELRRRQTATGTLRAPAAGGRDRAPFVLAPGGRPEVAVFWKNLLGVRRTPFARQALWAALALAVLFAAAAAAVAAQPSRVLGVAIGVVTAAAVGFLLAFTSTIAQRDDFRTDLVNAEALRTWPLSGARLAAGELAAPLFTATARLLFGLLGALALSLGGAAGLALSKAFVAFPHDQRLVELARPAAAAPWLAAALVATPPLLALLLVVQNATVLAFPAWFPPGQRRSAGPEVTGMRIVSLLGTVFVAALALLPAALLVGAAAWLGRGLGAAWLPALAPVAALPLAVEAAAGTWILGKLFERFDPALDPGA